MGGVHLAEVYLGEAHLQEVHQQELTSLQEKEVGPGTQRSRWWPDLQQRSPRRDLWAPAPEIQR